MELIIRNILEYSISLLTINFLSKKTSKKTIFLIKKQIDPEIKFKIRSH